MRTASTIRPTSEASWTSLFHRARIYGMEGPGGYQLVGSGLIWYFWRKRYLGRSR